jgi:acetyltransferase-like isoleucine patch superfamily enzyme
MSYLVNGIKNNWRKFKKIFGNFYFKTLLRKKHYLYISNSQLFINWIFQRIFRNQSYIPNSIHFTTNIQGYNNIIINGNPESIFISMAVSAGCYFTIFRNTTLTIGENTIWACNVCIQTGNHDFIDREKYTVADVKIGKNCWIGNSVTILAGVQLGDNVTVGANSVVTKSFPSNCVIAGCPAKVIRTFD